MQPFSLSQACERLIKAIESRQLSIRDNFLYAEPQQQIEGLGMERKWIEKTPLYHLVLDNFDQKTCDWYSRIVDDNYTPDWYVVRTDPDVSPLDLDDWHMAATSKVEALATVIEAMAYIRATPTKVIQDDQAITIYGEKGLLATVERMVFTGVSEENLQRATTALKGVPSWSKDHELSKALKKLQDFDQPAVECAIIMAFPVGMNAC